MNKLAYIFILLYSFNGYSQSTLSMCINAGSTFGSQKTAPTEIPSDCYISLLNSQNQLNYDESSDGLIKIIGTKNLLLSRVHDYDESSKVVLLKDEYTSGDKSKLTEIKAVDFNESDARIYVLNQENTQKQVYSYAYDIGGNNTPIRELHTIEIEQASNLRVDGKSSEIFLISLNDKWIKVFNRLADPDGRRPENSNRLLRSIQGPTTQLQAPIDLAIIGNELFILEPNKILVFNKQSNGNISPIRVIQGSNTNLLNAKRLEVSNDGNLEIKNGDNSILNFSPNANGNTSPL